LKIHAVYKHNHQRIKSQFEVTIMVIRVCFGLLSLNFLTIAFWAAVMEL